MNPVQSQSYLDLSVLPDLRTAVLATMPVVVFSENFDTVVWSNASGAQLFGGTTVLELLATKLPHDNAVLQQLRNAAAQIADTGKIVRGIRFGRTFRSQMLQFELAHIELPTGSHGFKTTQLIDVDEDTLSEDELARRAVVSLNGFADAAAILDDAGLPVYFSDRFAELGPDETDLANLVAELKTEEDRLIKRPINSNSGEVTAIGLARISDDPGRNLAVIAKVEEEKDAPMQVTDNAVSDDIDAKDLDDSGEDAPVSILVDEASEEPALNEIDVPEDTVEILEENEEPPVDAYEPSDQFEQQDNAVEQISDNQERDPAETTIQTSHAEPETSDTDIEQFVRFAWTVDSDSVFVSVSDELANVVGKNPSNIVGRRWDDVARVMGFDQDGQIQHLLKQRDTWSGKVVLWPVEGTEKVVPIDLAALPIFDTDRVFDGFRGYGKINISKMQDDPEAIGLAFAEGNTAPTFHDSTDSVVVELDVEEEPEILISQDDTEDASKQQEKPAANILPFSRNTAKPANTLNETERNALEAVRDHLQEDQEDTDTTSSPNPGQEPAKTVDTSLLEKLPVAVLVYRNDETLFANQQLLELSGYEDVQALGDAGGINALFNADESSSNTNGQILLTKDGDHHFVNATMHTVPWDEEKALLLSFAAPEVNAEPDALEFTEASEVQNILDTTADGIILLDEEGKIISINAPAEALFGVNFDDATGNDLEFLFATESKDTIRSYVDSVLTPGFESLLNNGEEAIAKESGGGMIPVYLTIAKLEQTGKLCAVIRDITSWKKVEEELIQSKQTAERASELKSEFLAQVSHEIRTPLNAIIGFSDVMIEERFGPIENDRYQEYLQDIRRSGVHVLDIINELLDLSKVESGKLDLSFEAVNLNEMVAETVALLQPQANSNRTIIRTSLSRVVPKVVADPRSVRQIILNLVSNAIKYSKANSQVIVSTVYETNGEVALRIRDTGEGMSQAEIETAMKPFRQVHSISENNPEGTGLGLPLTKALVEANRAYFELESNPGSGTIAHVQFPTQRVLAD